MLRNTAKLLNNTVSSCKSSKVNLNTALKSKEKWDLFSAVCLERKPVITPELNKLQKEYQQLLSELEFEKSLKCDHELRHELDLKQQELLKKGDEDIDVNLKQTAQDFVDACTEELSQFKPAPRITEADKKNDAKSLDRKLDKHLVLLVNQKIGEKQYYLLPQGIHQDGETLKQTAERVLKQNCGNELKSHIYGNAPCGLYKYKYPKEVRNNGAVGAKVFIYFARYLGGDLSQKGVDFKWLDRIEMDKILPEEYKKSVKLMLIDE